MDPYPSPVLDLQSRGGPGRGVPFGVCDYMEAELNYDIWTRVVLQEANRTDSQPQAETPAPWSQALRFCIIFIPYFVSSLILSWTDGSLYSWGAEAAPCFLVEGLRSSHLLPLFDGPAQVDRRWLHTGCC